MTKHDLAAQIEALSSLHDTYQRLRNYKPPRREATSRKDVAALGANFTARMQNLEDVSRLVTDLQKRLLATGYADQRLDSWLTVRTVGELSLSRPSLAGTQADRRAWKKRRGAKLDPAVMIDTGSDDAALEAICREIRAAILRLEAQEEAGDTAPAPAKVDPRTAARRQKLDAAETFIRGSKAPVNAGEIAKYVRDKTELRCSPFSVQRLIKPLRAKGLTPALGLKGGVYFPKK